jgi:hypothetical protein
MFGSTFLSGDLSFGRKNILPTDILPTQLLSCHLVNSQLAKGHFMYVYMWNNYLSAKWYLTTRRGAAFFVNKLLKTEQALTAR